MSERRAHTGLHGRGPVPVQAGIGLRAEHHDAFLASHPAVDWLEVHSENFFVAGGAQHEVLETVRASYPVSMHGVGLSLGSVDPIDPGHLKKLRQLTDRYQPFLVSEHLCWGSIGGRHLNDLLPLPYTDESLALMIDRVVEVQDHLGRQMLVENISSYLEFAHSHIPEWEFLNTLARRSGCGILLDVNNVYVSACNHGFDPHRYIDAMDADAVLEIHLAGHSVNRYGDRDILIDTHNAPVCDAVWQLYDYALRHTGAVPTLIEWDSDLPEIGVLVDEAMNARTRMRASRDIAA